MDKEQKRQRISGKFGFILPDENVSKGKSFNKNEVGMGSYEVMHEEQQPKGFFKYFKYLISLRR